MYSHCIGACTKMPWPRVKYTLHQSRTQTPFGKRSRLTQHQHRSHCLKWNGWGWECTCHYQHGAGGIMYPAIAGPSIGALTAVHRVNQFIVSKPAVWTTSTSPCESRFHELVTSAKAGRKDGSKWGSWGHLQRMEWKRWRQE